MSDTEREWRELFGSFIQWEPRRRASRWRKFEIEKMLEPLKSQGLKPQLPIELDPSEDTLDKARYRLVANLVDPRLLNERVGALFVEPRIVAWSMVLETAGTETLAAYISWFATFDELYRQILTLQVVSYFLARWVRDDEPVFRPEHELKLISISKSSPTKTVLEGAESGLKALGEALSLGDQYQKFRTAGAKAQEAKAAAAKAELEVEAMRREKAKAEAIAPADIEVELERKRLELEELRRRQEEAELALRRLRRQDFDETLSLLEKYAPVINQLPPEMRSQLQASLTKSLMALQESSIEITGYRQLTDGEPSGTPAGAAPAG